MRSSVPVVGPRDVPLCPRTRSTKGQGTHLSRTRPRWTLARAIVRWQVRGRAWAGSGASVRSAPQGGAATGIACGSFGARAPVGDATQTHLWTWAYRKQDGCPTRYGTTVLNDLADLTPLLGVTGTAV